ncbi:MAG: leucine--tRNA ligase, partial [Candidatus Methanomethylophilaceae archaeon]
AEEMWSMCKFEGMVSEAQLPEIDRNQRSASSEYGEDLIRDVMADIAQIIKVTGMQPKRIVLYTASAWKVDVMKKAVELLEEGKLDIPTLTKKCMASEDLRKKGKAVSDLAKKVASDYMRLSVDKVSPIVELNETAHLTDAARFMSSEIGYKVEVLSADAEEIYDPQGKAKVAVPGRPAIFLE